MGRHVLQRHIWGYSVCLCPIKGTPGLNELIQSLPYLSDERKPYKRAIIGQTALHGHHCVPESSIENYFILKFYGYSLQWFWGSKLSSLKNLLIKSEESRL